MLETSAKLEAEILRQYEFAEDFSDATVVLVSPQEIIYWSAGAVKYFGYTERAAIGQELSLIFPDFGILKDLIETEFAKQIDAHAQEKSAQGKRVGHGALLDARSKDGVEIQVKCSIYPLFIDPTLCLVLFFAVEAAHPHTDNAIAATHPNSPFSANQSNPFIFGAQTVLFIWKTQPILFAILIVVGLAGLGIWRVESVGKAYKDIRGGEKETAKPSPTPNGTVVDIDPKTGDRTIRFGG